MEVFPFKSRIPHPERMPDILITPPPDTADLRAEHDVTVVPIALPPPVVPVPNPTS
jgi:hypothetical protein